MNESAIQRTDFAFEVGQTQNGRKLLICGQEYEAWNYDTYIYDAISIARKWEPEQITYDRIVHLRYWLRENIQHGHDLNYHGLRSMAGAKSFVDKVIALEYRGSEWDDQRRVALKNNQEIFANKK